MFKLIIFLSIIELSKAFPIKSMHGHFEKCFSEKCIDIDKVNIIENECSKLSKELTVFFFINKKKYYGILDKEYKIKDTSCSFSDEGSLKEIFIFKDGLNGFFNDAYDLIYAVYAGFLQLILGLLGFKKIKHIRENKEEKDKQKNKDEEIINGHDKAFRSRTRDTPERPQWMVSPSMSQCQFQPSVIPQIFPPLPNASHHYNGQFQTSNDTRHGSTIAPNYHQNGQFEPSNDNRQSSTIVPNHNNNAQVFPSTDTCRNSTIAQKQHDTYYMPSLNPSAPLEPTTSSTIIGNVHGTRSSDDKQKTCTCCKNKNGGVCGTKQCSCFSAKRKCIPECHRKLDVRCLNPN